MILTIFMVFKFEFKVLRIQSKELLKACPGWDANPGSFNSYFIYFLSLYRWATDSSIKNLVERKQIAFHQHFQKANV